VKKESYFAVNQILYNLKFRKYEPKSYLKYISVEDFIGLDALSGKLIHIHLHYEIRIGRKYLEDYHLPFEEYICRNRIYHEKYEIFMLDPNLEIILLVIRYILQNGKIHGDFSKKLFWYKEKIRIQKVYQFAEELLNASFAKLIIHYLSGSNDKKNFYILRKETIAQVVYYRTSIKVISSFTYTKRKFEAAFNYFLLKICHLPYPYRRVDPCGGKVIVFIGIDGSGKSTLIKEIERWFNWKVDLFSLYFGSGDGRSSIIRYPLWKLFRFAKRLNRGKTNAGTEQNHRTKRDKARSSILFNMARTIWAITLACEKKNKLNQMWRAKSRGLTVLCDRFPQDQVVDLHDGPLLSKWLINKRFIARKIAQWEFNIYQLVNTYHPDIVIKLNISEEIALKRKPEINIIQLKKKVDAINKIQFSKNTIVHEFDTSEALEITLAKIKNLIW